MNFFFLSVYTNMRVLLLNILFRVFRVNRDGTVPIGCFAFRCHLNKDPKNKFGYSPPMPSWKYKYKNYHNQNKPRNVRFHLVCGLVREDSTILGLFTGSAWWQF